MEREIVKIDEDLCTGCGDCVPACHEGALQIIDGKARLVSDLMCDGLGACLGHCPEGAITIEKREAEPYDEMKVMEDMVEKGANTVIAHLKHLKDHKEMEYLKQGVHYLRNNETKLDFDVHAVLGEVHENAHEHQHQGHGGGCPGAREINFAKKNSQAGGEMVSGQSELRQWPIQMHLINPMASYFQNANLVLAADCVAFAMGNFHQKYLKGNSLAIACPKLDEGQESYMDKLLSLIDGAKINTINVMIMQVPCCSGLLQMARQAVEQAQRKVPIKATVISLEGEVLQEEWV